MAQADLKFNNLLPQPPACGFVLTLGFVVLFWKGKGDVVSSEYLVKMVAI